MARPPTFTVTYKGEERYLSELCREHDIPWDTVRARMRRGMSIEDALTKPRRYPRKRKKVGHRRGGRGKPAPAAEESTVAAPDRLPLHPMLEEAVSMLVDSREIILSLELTPRRLRLLSEIRSWLRRAGWR